jgi:hypothetical protein
MATILAYNQFPPKTAVVIRVENKNDYNAIFGLMGKSQK